MYRIFIFLLEKNQQLCVQQCKWHKTIEELLATNATVELPYYRYIYPRRIFRLLDKRTHTEPGTCTLMTHHLALSLIVQSSLTIISVKASISHFLKLVEPMGLTQCPAYTPTETFPKEPRRTLTFCQQGIL